jgi:hypothetical protein
MLEEYTFEQDRLDGTFLGMQQVAAFRPDDITVPQVQDIIDDAQSARGTYLDKLTGQTQKVAAFHTALDAVHDTCTTVHAAMRSRYRKDPTSMEQIEKIPVQDQTIGETTQRAEVLVRVWKLLPLPENAPPQPGPLPHYFLPHEGMSVSVLEAQQTALGTSVQQRRSADTEFEKAEAELHTQERRIHDFNVAAGEQGRAQFPDLQSEERELIDSIPTEPPVSAPGPASVQSAEVRSSSSVKLKAASARASKFDWQKLDANQEWQDFAMDVPLSILIAEGLSAGELQFRVRGKNSRGTTEWSDPVSVPL